MNAKYVNGLNFKSGGFKLVDYPAQRTGCVRTGENVFVHEHSPNLHMHYSLRDKARTKFSKDEPDEILILPTWPQSRDLKYKSTIVIKQVENLAHESLISPDTDMLRLLQRNNFGEAASGQIGNIMGIHAEYSCSVS